MLAGSELVGPVAGGCAESVSRIVELPLGRVPAGTAADVDGAVAAQRTFPAWAGLRHRMKVLRPDDVRGKALQHFVATSIGGRQNSGSDTEEGLDELLRYTEVESVHVLTA